MAEGREAVIIYEFLRGRQNEAVIQDLGVASAAAPEIFPFQEPLQDGGSQLYREWHTLE